jgi:phospholipid-transporting ATPase
MQYLEDYAKEGLRTLIVAEREVSQEFYDKWDADYKKACTVMKDREKFIDEAAAKIENNFELIGATAIEDKL